MVRLLVDQADGGIVGLVGPVDSARLKILAHRLDRTQELALFDSERADRELYRRPVPQPDQRLKHGEGILASGKRHRHAIAVADHVKARDGLADLAQECLCEIQASIIAPRAPKPLTRRAENLRP